MKKFTVKPEDVSPLSNLPSASHSKMPVISFSPEIIKERCLHRYPVISLQVLTTTFATFSWPIDFD